MVSFCRVPTCSRLCPDLTITNQCEPSLPLFHLELPVETSKLLTIKGLCGVTLLSHTK